MSRVLPIELEKELKGSYSTSFFHIYMDGEFQTDLNLLSTNDRGTFIHEYVHYWQNIGTLWGLGNSILFYNEIRCLVNEIKSINDIKIPLHINFPKNICRERKKYTIGNGTCSYDKYEGKCIDRSQKIVMSFDYDTSLGVRIPTIKLHIRFTDGSENDLYLGAHIIKESMAAMYQSLIDTESSHPDVPYNIIKILCMDYYPNYCNNIEFLICACYASLFSMKPGDTFIQLMEYAAKENITDGITLLSTHFDTCTVCSSKHNSRISITKCFDDMIDCFIKNLEDNLIAPLDYIKTVLNRMRLSHGWLPLL